MKKTAKKMAPFRLTAPWLNAFGQLRTAVDEPRQVLFEDAVAYWMGKSDPMIAARRKAVLKAFDEGKAERPFNPPLTPSMSNVLTAAA